MDRANEYYLRVESALLEKNFQVLRVGSLEQFLERTKGEIFHVYVIFFHGEAYLQGTLDAIKRHFPSKLTPKVLIGPSIQFSQEHSTMLNQYFLLDTEPGLVAEFCDETAGLFYQENRKIRIGQFDVPRILANLSTLRFTGEVDMDSREEACSVYFHFGKIVCASSKREDQKFGQLLLQFGIVTPQQIDHVLGLVSTQGKRIGQIFVDQGLITNAKLLEVLELQVKHIVIPTFNWEDGEAEIVVQSADPRENFPIQIDVPRLIKEGIRLRFSDPELEKKLAIRNHYVRCVPNKQVVLDDRDAAVFQYFQGARQRVDAALISNRFSRTELLRDLYFFSLFDLVEFREAVQKDDVPVEKKASLEKLYQDAGEDTAAEVVAPSPPARRPRAPFLGLLLLAAGGGAAWFVARSRAPDEPNARPPVVASVVTPVPSPSPAPPSPAPEPTVAPVVAVEAPPAGIPAAAPKPPAEKPLPADDLSARVRQARAERAAKRFAQAEAICAEVVRRAPTNESCLQLLGEMWVDQEKYAEARGAFEKILAHRPDHARANLQLGTILIEDGDAAGARVHLQRFIEHADAKADARLVAEAQKVLQSLEAAQ